ncbi:hypothetical protein C1646_816451 [Rhizophagus diaphanus]|nr:hypothetical protein C1646_816451 [Rhizophagus diaphanus] [Rhizophagus sp. MUCL 43196]
MNCLFQFIKQFFVLTLYFLLGFILAPSVIIVEIVLRCNWCINKVNKSRQEIIETIEIFEQQEIIEEHEYDIEQCDIIQDHKNINHESQEWVEEIGPNSNENWIEKMNGLNLDD